MATPRYSVPCLRNDCIARDIYEIVFEKPKGFQHEAGQFVLWDVPLLADMDDIQPRAFSIASAPQEPELLFVTKLKEGGRASNWVEKILKAGTQVSFVGPFGRFLISEGTRDILFVCTSTGNAPFRAQIIDMLDKGDTRRIDFVFGVRDEQDLFWTEELDQLTQSYPNFFLHIALSQPSDSWKGHRGRVQTLVPLIAKDIIEKDIYVCGSPDMTNEIKKLCLEEWGVPKEQVHVEGYV